MENQQKDLKKAKSHQENSTKRVKIISKSEHDAEIFRILRHNGRLDREDQITRRKSEISVRTISDKENGKQSFKVVESV